MILWREIQRTNFTKLSPLIEFLELSKPLQEELLARPQFPLNLPKRLAEKIEKNTLEDPILKQFVPLKEETKTSENFSLHPVKDPSFQKSPKLLQKYQGRALFMPTSACAMHCRYCFRQNFPYETTPDFEKELSFLKKDPSIEEIILSGGDPLSLPDKTLDFLLSAFNTIPHIRRVRFHTRFPIGIPERIDASFLKTLQSFQKQTLFIIHCNHPKELDTHVFTALRSLQSLGIPVLNQAVLLKGVNDAASTLIELCQTLANHGILPYYLHLLDRVQGAMHFEAPFTKKLFTSLQEALPGYAVPRFVQEEPGKPSKTFLY